MTKYKNSIFIFRRDLRLFDNTALIAALNESENVIPLFIFTPSQISFDNKLRSENAIQFMIESLFDLEQQLKNNDAELWTAYGNEIDVIDNICNKINIESIYVNEDYSPYSIKRDNKINKYCTNNKIIFNVYTDILLIDDLLNVKTGNDTRYNVFTMFYNKTKIIPIRKPEKNSKTNYMKKSKQFKKLKLDKINNFILDNNYYKINDDLAINGGRTNALKILSDQKIYKSYNDGKDYLNYKTTMLSAHNKFGTVSIREVYYASKREKTGELSKKLYWRDFYYYVSVHNVNFYKYKHISKKINPGISLWTNNKNYLSAWKNGKTGFPVIDAAMNQLNISGYMHNRARMIVAEFLTKDLLVDWKYGEKYFTKKLVDIDRIQNTGNWNWSSSFGLDNSSFLRIFNPWTQSIKFDKEAEYIKHWLPVLKDVPANHIHNWYKYYESYPEIEYIKPIIDHSIQRKIFISAYKKYFK